MTLLQISKLNPNRLIRVNGPNADAAFKFDWSIDASGRIFRYEYPGQYRKRKLISLAAFILGVNARIDHKNRDNWDNRVENLRVCSQAQNCYNKAKKAESSSNYKGVSWFERDKCWRARIQFKQKQYYLGYFSTQEAAAKAYDIKAKEFFGEFAVLNFP